MRSVRMSEPKGDESSWREEEESLLDVHRSNTDGEQDSGDNGMRDTLGSSEEEVQEYASMERMLSLYCKGKLFPAKSSTEAGNAILLTLPGILGPLHFLHSLLTAISHGGRKCSVKLGALLERFLSSFVSFFTPDPALLIGVAASASSGQVLATMVRYRDHYEAQRGDLEGLDFDRIALSSPRGADQLFELDPTQLAGILTQFYVEALEAVPPGGVVGYLVGAKDATNPLPSIHSITESLSEALAMHLLRAPDSRQMRNRARRYMHLAENFYDARNLELLYVITSVLGTEGIGTLARLTKRQRGRLQKYQELVHFRSNYKFARHVMAEGRYQVPLLQVIGRDLDNIKNLPGRNDDGELCLDTLESIASVVISVFRGVPSFRSSVLEGRDTAMLAGRPDSIYTKYRPTLCYIRQHYGDEEWTHRIRLAVRGRLNSGPSSAFSVQK